MLEKSYRFIAKPKSIIKDLLKFKPLCCLFLKNVCPLHIIYREL